MTSNVSSDAREAEIERLMANPLPVLMIPRSPWSVINPKNAVWVNGKSEGKDRGPDMFGGVFN